MINVDTICPYTGLRSFTEEESLYFKGRDIQIEKICRQLEEKKFLMITGASGDGKSSLIFAGLIPQARAGFFRAKYSSWYVASFRPERTPLTNMVKAVSVELEIEDQGIAEVEMKRGFSSLVELYKASPRYINENDAAWKEAPFEKRERIERRAGNLLIIVDQFEEFFTNPENFPNGVPSQEARLLLNTLLETAKIALRDDLPIYIVCTMRSDYIGQCAAFRGLPEFIGFSQFFVPRLRRKELQQVIEEPAVLSGCRITKRLIDRLILDLEETEDQLPILQHALKQIWLCAQMGTEEMDLLHYARVGGLSGDDLPKEHVADYKTWRQTRPDYEQRCLEDPGLANVLDIHANKLYYQASAYYRERYPEQLTEKEVRLIIAIAFACLTRIDENRAVRNRMTVQEIAQIVNVEKLDAIVVGRVLNIFREPENTILRPFMLEEDKNREAGPSTIIDITHEALIRNWQMLKNWAARENEYYNVYQDFKQQLNRWIENGKSADYLLAIGPLTFFENWYNDCRPNEYWFNRYNDSQEDPDIRMAASRQTMRLTREYLRKSKLNLLVTRAFMRYGASRILLVTSGIVLIFVSVFLGYEWYQRQNKQILSRLMRESSSYLSSIEATPFSKAEFVVNAERLHPGYFRKTVPTLSNTQHQIDIALGISTVIFNRHKYGAPAFRKHALRYADSLIRASAPVSLDHAEDVNSYLLNVNALIRGLSFYSYFIQDAEIEEMLSANASAEAEFLMRIFSGNIYPKLDQKVLHVVLMNALNYKSLQVGQRAGLLEMMSPFEGSINRNKFDSLFPARESITVGAYGRLSHRGVYEKLAYLYASLGNTAMVRNCLDSIYRYNNQYHQAFNNPANIGGYFLAYGFKDEFLTFAGEYAARLKTTRYLFTKEIVAPAGVFDLMNQLKDINNGNFNDNLGILSLDELKELYRLYTEVIVSDLRDVDERNFAMALRLKQEAVLLDKKYRERSLRYDRARIDSLFDLSYSFYKKLPDGFLGEPVSLRLLRGLGWAENMTMKRRSIYLYPDHLKVLEPTTIEYDSRFYGVAFFNYMKRKGIFRDQFSFREDFELLCTWIDSYLEMKGLLHPLNYFNRSFLNYHEVDHATFVSLDSLIQASGFAQELDDAGVQMQLILNFLERGDTVRAFAHADRLKFLRFIRDSWAEEYTFENYKVQVSGALARHGRIDYGHKIVSRFNRPQNRAVFYAKLAALTYMGTPSMATTLLDSARKQVARITDFTLPFDFIFAIDIRTPGVEIETLMGHRDEAQLLIGSMFTQQMMGIKTMIRSYARKDDYYQAMTAVPVLANPEDLLQLSNEVLYREVLRSRTKENTIGWSEYDRDYQEFQDFTYFRYDTY